MKKLRVILSALAIIIAMGTALVSEALSPMLGYEFIPAGEDPAACVFRSNECDTQGGWDCKVNNSASTPILREFVSATSCGAALKRQTAPPNP